MLGTWPGKMHTERDNDEISDQHCCHSLFFGRRGLLCAVAEASAHVKVQQRHKAAGALGCKPTGKGSVAASLLTAAEQQENGRQFSLHQKLSTFGQQAQAKHIVS